MKYKKLVIVFIIGLLSTVIVISCSKGGSTPVEDITYTVIEGGILYDDMTLTTENSPYSIVGLLQVDNNVTLTIDPGVEIFRGRIEVFGTLKINGTVDNRVLLNSVGIVSGYTGDVNDAALIEINYVNATGGTIYGANSYAGIIIRNSVLRDMGEIHIVYITDHTYIEKNIFINSGPIVVGYSAFIPNLKLYFRNNILVGDSGLVVTSNSDDLLIQYNSFLETNKVVVSLQYNSSTNATVENNYWNTLDIDIIDSMIFDKNDDLNVEGTVSYIPFLTEPDVETPSYP